MSNNESFQPSKEIEHQQRLYHEYAQAASVYLRKPTVNNWEKKEKALETYNALIIGTKRDS